MTFEQASNLVDLTSNLVTMTSDVQMTNRMLVMGIYLGIGAIFFLCFRSVKW